MKQVCTFMETKIAPTVTKYWVEDAFPFEILPALKNSTLVASPCRVMAAEAEVRSYLV
jgi:hypothetical protein